MSCAREINVPEERTGAHPVTDLGLTGTQRLGTRWRRLHSHRI
jgi:hypothetical protein